MAHYLDVIVKEPCVAHNTFRASEQDRAFPTQFAEARPHLPAPFWHGARAPHALAAYWRALELIFRNLQRATARSGFAGPFADAAFNDCLFMWDSAFMACFW